MYISCGHMYVCMYEGLCMPVCTCVCVCVCVCTCVYLLTVSMCVSHVRVCMVGQIAWWGLSMLCWGCYPDNGGYCAGSGWEYQGGTSAYTAPELLLGARSKRARDAPKCFTLCGPAADCWALGATAFQMLTACSLFETDIGVRPADLADSPDAASAWNWRYTADLHRDWVRLFSSCL
jgi:hypothetical protein